MAPPHEPNHYEIQLEPNNSRNMAHTSEIPPPVSGDNPSRPSRIARFSTWIQKPMNLVVFLWAIPTVISCILMVCLMFGAFVSNKERRKIWEEDNNQIMNALFTVGCLFSHPEVFYHLLYAIRWKEDDQKLVRNVYCSTKTPENSDRRHLLIVTGLINLTWVGQYVMCGLYWAYNRHNRPGGVMGFWIVITIFAPVVASIYTVRGPLKSPKTTNVVAADNRVFKMYRGGLEVQNPEWNGGMFDICSEPSVTLSSFFCGFYVFGRNASRLGFGKRNMHIVTFIIAVVSPFVTFFITSKKIDNDGIKVVLVVSGALMSWAGFFYGGFWRVRMRERFGLPESNACCGVPFLADYFAWFLCAPCALAQEVRTAEAYDIEEVRIDVAPSVVRENSKGDAMAAPRAPTM